MTVCRQGNKPAAPSRTLPQRHHAQPPRTWHGQLGFGHGFDRPLKLLLHGWPVCRPQPLPPALHATCGRRGRDRSGQAVGWATSAGEWSLAVHVHGAGVGLVVTRWLLWRRGRPGRWHTAIQKPARTRTNGSAGGGAGGSRSPLGGARAGSSSSAVCHHDGQERGAVSQRACRGRCWRALAFRSGWRVVETADACDHVAVVAGQPPRRTEQSGQQRSTQHPCICTAARHPDRSIADRASSSGVAGSNAGGAALHGRPGAAGPPGPASAIGGCPRMATIRWKVRGGPGKAGCSTRRKRELARASPGPAGAVSNPDQCTRALWWAGTGDGPRQGATPPAAGGCDAGYAGGWPVAAAALKPCWTDLCYSPGPSYAGRSASRTSCPITRWAGCSELPRRAERCRTGCCCPCCCPPTPCLAGPPLQWEMVKSKEKTPEHTHVLIDLGFVVGAHGMAAGSRARMHRLSSCCSLPIQAPTWAENPLCSSVPALDPNPKLPHCSPAADHQPLRH